MNAKQRRLGRRRRGELSAAMAGRWKALGEVFAEDLFETMNRESFTARLFADPGRDKRNLEMWLRDFAMLSAHRRSDEPQGVPFDG